MTPIVSRTPLAPAVGRATDMVHMGRGEGFSRQLLS